VGNITGKRETGGGTNTWTTTNWVGSADVKNTATGLPYTGLTITGGANTKNGVYRTFGAQVATGEYWVSFLMRNADDGVVSLTNGAVTIGSQTIGRTKLSMGGASNVTLNTINNNTNNSFVPGSIWRVDSPAGQGAFISSLSSVDANVHMFVARLDMTNSRAHYWVDPNLAVNISSATALNGPSGTALTGFAFDGVMAFGSNAGVSTIDERRIGTTAVDVGVTIPEPASIGLLGLAGLVTLSRRRRSLITRFYEGFYTSRRVSNNARRLFNVTGLPVTTQWLQKYMPGKPVSFERALFNMPY